MAVCRSLIAGHPNEKKRQVKQIVAYETKKPLAIVPRSHKVVSMTDTAFNDLSSLGSYLKTRRSSRPRNMTAPGPSDAELRDFVATAIRTPDHGKLSPWRVVQVDLDQRDALAQGFIEAYRADKPDAGRLEIEGLEKIAHEAPALLIVLFSPVSSTKIPVWEQELSTGAFCMNILHAIHEKGYVGGWITGWPAYSDRVRDMFGGAPEKIAGFLYAGTAREPLEERGRPDLERIFGKWEPAGH